jgi:hypothetical protein
MIALVCIAKNEDHYIDEWIDYHKKLGFDEIFIYQNDWISKSINPRAVYKTINGLGMQSSCYNDFISDYREKFEWVAFLDVDEYFVLNKHMNVSEFLKDYIHLPALGINWYLFGDCGCKGKILDYSTLKRFTKRGAHVDPHIKTILNLRMSMDAIMNVHSPDCVLGDTSGKLFKGNYNHGGPTDVAQINHYYCRTINEYIAKWQRGVACEVDQNIKPSYRSIAKFNLHNLNDIQDMTAYNFMYGS